MLRNDRRPPGLRSCKYCYITNFQKANEFFVLRHVLLINGWLSIEYAQPYDVEMTRNIA